MYLEPKVVLQHLIEPRTVGGEGDSDRHLSQETGSSCFPHPICSLSRTQLLILYNLGNLKVWMKDLK